MLYSLKVSNVWTQQYVVGEVDLRRDPRDEHNHTKCSVPRTILPLMEKCMNTYIKYLIGLLMHMTVS